MYQKWKLLATLKEAITHSNIEGLMLPKQKEISDQKFVERAESTYEKLHNGIEKELKIEQGKAKVDKNTIEEASKELCGAKTEQLFKEVVTEIVDQRMNIEDNENREEASRGISWLIKSLMGKQKKRDIPRWRLGAESSEAVQER